MSPCCSLNLYRSIQIRCAKMTTSLHEDINSAQIGKSKGSMNQSGYSQTESSVCTEMEASRCTVQRTPATVLVSVPVPYLDLVHSIKGLARKPTPRRVQPGDHARRELLPYLPTCPPLSPPFKSTCAASSHPVPFPSWFFLCQLNIVQLLNLVIDCRAHTYRYSLFDSRHSNLAPGSSFALLRAQQARPLRPA